MSELMIYVFDVSIAIEAPDIAGAESTLGLVLDRAMKADYAVASVAKYGCVSIHHNLPNAAARATPGDPDA